MRSSSAESKTRRGDSNAHSDDEQDNKTEIPFDE
jgi:hypothetical protein